MQPYFLPYIGYFQLLTAVDRFVVLDDVNFINRGWINRNKISSNEGGEQWITIPLEHASQNRLISDIDILADNGWKKKMCRHVAATYCAASQTRTVGPMFDRWIAAATGNLSKFLVSCMGDAASYLGIRTEIVRASALHPRSGLRGSDRILDICRQEGATTYINPPGGRLLYEASEFRRREVELRFLEPNLEMMELAHAGTGMPTLSILDLMMRNAPGRIQDALGSYRLTET